MESTKIFSVATVLALACLLPLNADAKKSDTVSVSGAQGSNGSSGGDADPPFTPEFIWMKGTVKAIQLYELVDTIYFNAGMNIITYYVPADIPEDLYEMTVTEDVDLDGDNVPDVKAGDVYLLDFGPEWYTANPCLVGDDAWVCDETLATSTFDLDGVTYLSQYTGPYLVGDFNCENTVWDTVVLSNDPALTDTAIPLLGRSQVEAAVVSGEEVYAFGRVGGSEIVWLEYVESSAAGQGNDDDEYVLYEKTGSNIVWEASFESDDFAQQYWWRGEAPPQAMTSELNCEIEESE